MYHSIGEHIKNEKHNKWRVKTNDFEKQMNWFYKNNWKSLLSREKSSKYCRKESDILLRKNQK